MTSTAAAEADSVMRDAEEEEEEDWAAAPAFSLSSSPFDLGSVCFAAFALDDWRPAEIVERRQADGGWECYVHFTQLNRRLDRWVAERDLRPAAAATPTKLTATAAAAAASTPPFSTSSSRPSVSSAHPDVHRSNLTGPAPARPTLLRSSSPQRRHAATSSGVDALSSPSAPSSSLLAPLVSLLSPFRGGRGVAGAGAAAAAAAAAASPPHLAAAVSPSRASSTFASPSSSDRRLTRRERRLIDHAASLADDPQLVAYTDEGEVEIEREHAEKTKVRNIQQVVIVTPAAATALPSPQRGQHAAALPLSSAYLLDCWYYSPYPPPFRQASRLHVCGFCLSYFLSSSSLCSHLLSARCLPHPPGAEIYRDPHSSPAPLSVWEVDGERQRLWCQSLCLLSKLFIDHKTAVFDTEPFLFYCLCLQSEHGFTLVAYFSREKQSADSNNVACILTFPQHQRAGYGRFLISLSYALSQREGRPGGPERPLSDLGRLSYLSWWSERLLHELQRYGDGAVCSLEDLSAATGMRRDDIVRVLRQHELVRYVKGQYVVTVSGRRMDDWRRQSSGQQLGHGRGGRGEDEQRRGGGRPAAAARCDFDVRLLDWRPPVSKGGLTQTARDRKSGS